uniref:Endoglucanase M n=1 Tax=Clostridium cellulovorans TaxID=1493 RepID=Q9LAJ2_CLOCL|nr:endoglucanase M [Clostridium cellulovorans 743B]
MNRKKITAYATAIVTVLSIPTVATSVVTSKSVSAATNFDYREIIANNTFDNNNATPWTLVQNYPAIAKMVAKDGKCSVTVLNDGVEGRWDVQLRHRGIVLDQGHKYRVRFTVTADKDCYIYPKIGDQGEPYREYWNYNSYQRIQLKAGVPTTVDQTFEMKDPTAKTAEFAFHLAGDCKAATFPYTFTFDDIYLTDPNRIPPPPPPEEPTNAVRVNQVGYFTNLQKKATVVTKATSPITWYLKNSAGVQVATGETKVLGADAASGDNVHIIDFSNYTTEGSDYTLSVDQSNIDSLICNSASSLPFAIGKELYNKLQKDAMKYFYLNRSGIPITMPYAERTDLTRVAGHTLDVIATDASSTDPSPWYKENYSLEVTGGWYDDTRYNKSVINGSISAWTIMNQYERALKANKVSVIPFADNTMNIPESGNGYPDILDEVRFQMEMMMKMQIPAGKTYSGMVHHRAKDERWIPLATRPDQDQMKRYLEPPSTAATLDLAATAAQSSRLWAKYDSTFANQCLVSAETAWAAAIKNPAIYAPLQSSFSGTYGDTNIADEFYWAAAELYETTGKQQYLDYLKNNCQDKFLKIPTKIVGGEANGVSGCFDSGDVTGLGTISLAIGDKLDVASKTTARANIAAAADVFVANTQKEGYGTPMDQGIVGQVVDQNGYVTKPIEGYPYASNSYVTNEAIVMGYAYDFTKNRNYLNGVVSAMDYILGRNPMVQSYVTGYGSNPVENPHNVFWAYQYDNTFPKAPAGCMASGPNSGLQDSWVKASGWTPGSRPAAKCFMDNIESWSTNDLSNSYNASLAWVSSYVNLNSLPESIKGDINNDAKINAIDLALLKKYILNNDIPIVAINGDINGDGIINAIDLLLLKKQLLA